MLKGWDTARLDVSLHDVIHPVPACCFPRIQGLPEFMTVHMLVGAPPFLCKVRQDVGEKLAAVRKGACRDVGWRVSEPQPEDFQDTELDAVGGFPSRTPCVTPVLSLPDSDSRMKMGWKILTETVKSGVCFFQSAGVCGRGGYFRCLRALWTGSGRDRTAQHGRFLVVAPAPVCIRTGGAQQSGRILESGVCHCQPVCGGLTHP